jgi:ribosomal protein S4E
VGIGTNAPNSTLQVTGSISTNIKAQTAATYTIAATDHTVFCNLAASMTVTLPTAVGISGRIYIIKNINTNSSSSITINTTSGQTIDTYASGGIVISYLGHSGFASTITLQSNGSNWYILSIY